MALADPLACLCRQKVLPGNQMNTKVTKTQRKATQKQRGTTPATQTENFTTKEHPDTVPRVLK
jgi:hypothetical protein